ncbi:ubiquitin-like domain-containing protein [Evansella sp. LMS18]|uniref:G5 and 3D domain-containing protein n=1 Tax=Evansella sp. LMS18 TaxID=2924033 RepID=UPI0020D0B3E0|nr:G5 and 3D domain-containing protein [Evansella sp. LMS18]UTR12433.1 ubiquitin-like domain-containing protein [Evansella sp. LMS18]
MNQWMKQLYSRISWRKLAVSSVGLLTLIGIVVFAVYELTKASVTIGMEEDISTVYTHASTVGEVLEERGIEVSIHDDIDPPQDTDITDTMEITVTPAQQVEIHTDGESQKVWTTAGTVEELLDELEIEVNEHDKISPDPGEVITENTLVSYETAFLITLYSDGEEKEVWTTSTTVADFLENENIALNELDRVEPSLDDLLAEETEVNVVRVEKVTDVVEEEIDFATVRKNDSSVERGTEKVLNSGKNGTLAKYYEVILEDGEEASRELIKEEIVAESEDRVVAVGTKEPQPVVSRGASASTENTSSTNSSSSSSASAASSSSSSNSSSGGSSGSNQGSWRTFTATAYTANCSGCSGITYTGVNLKNNPNAKVIAVDPSVIPLGSRVEVKGYGTYLAADIGGAINGNKIDIFIPDTNKVRSFGRRTVEVRVLD